jgi:hypothetical protein
MVSVECSTANGILAWFELQENYNFVIYRGIKEGFVSCHYDGSSKEEADNRLQNFLLSIEPQNDNIYYLKLQGSGKAKEKTILPGLIFRLNSAPKFGANMYNVPVPAPNQNNEILSRLAAIENSLQGEEEEEEAEEKNLIGTLLNEPSIKNMLISGIGSIMANLLTPALPANAPIALAGVWEETTEDLQHYITVLFSKGVTITDLKTLSEKSEGELNLLLSILRK